MKSFLIVALLLAGGGYLYLRGGSEMIQQYLNPQPLPETIDVETATFMGTARENPHAK
jgi:hypothetical protein